MNIALVVVGKDYLGSPEYVRYLNRCRDVKVRAETALTAAEVEEFRTKPGSCVEGYVPPEPEPKRA